MAENTRRMVQLNEETYTTLKAEAKRNGDSMTVTISKLLEKSNDSRHLKNIIENMIKKDDEMRTREKELVSKIESYGKELEQYNSTIEKLTSFIVGNPKSGGGGTNTEAKLDALIKKAETTFGYEKDNNWLIKMLLVGFEDHLKSGFGGVDSFEKNLSKLEATRSNFPKTARGQ